MIKALGILLAAVLGVQPVLAAPECVLSRAIYTQPQSDWSLRFRPLAALPAPMAATTNAFEMRSGDAVGMFGDVSWQMGDARPVGSLGYQCPDEGGSEADYAQCTLWSGVIYAISRPAIDLLPAEDAPAPQTLLLSDFGRQVRYSTPFETLKLETAPWDVFTLSGCDEPH